MEKWTVEEPNGELRLAPLRALGLDRFTWAHLLYGRLSQVQVYVLYFPSRFDLPIDKTTIDALRTFGTNTGPGTSVNIWDTRHSNCSASNLRLLWYLPLDSNSKTSILAAPTKPTSTPLRSHTWMFLAVPT